MPKSKGIDFSQLFDPDVVGDGPTAPGYMVNGVPLRFAHIKYGTKRADVGYAEKGVDLSNKWAAKGTASYWSLVDVVSGGMDWPTTSGTAMVMYSKAKLTFAADGNLREYQEGQGSGNRQGYDLVHSDAWLKSGAAGSYQVRFRYALYSDPDGMASHISLGNSAPGFVALSADQSFSLSAGGGYADSDLTYKTHLVQYTVYVDLKHPDGTVETKTCRMGVTLGTT